MVSGTHLAALDDNTMVNLHGILGSDVARARVFGGNHCPDAKVNPGLAELCADTSLDFAIVTTLPNARKDIVDALVDAGLPILMEKPVERTLKAAIEIAVRCETGGAVAGIVFQHRVGEGSQALKTAIASGDLGELVAAERRMSWWRDKGFYDQAGRGWYARDGGGVVISQAIHTLDLVIWPMGPVATVQAMMATTSLHEFEAENWAGGLVQFANGAVATLTATTSFYPGGQESIRVQGTRAHAHL
jgi:UDP-N-acetyl-2-amino-2-deoxyglucuronate dehydrogenase